MECERSRENRVGLRDDPRPPCGAGKFTGDKRAPLAQPEGYIEGTDKPGLVPESLYERQLAERWQGEARAENWRLARRGATSM